MTYSKEFIDHVKDHLRVNRKHNSVNIMTKQYIPSLNVNSIKQNAPFIYYLHCVLKEGDKAPRGKFFKNKIVKRPRVFMDELSSNF